MRQIKFKNYILVVLLFLLTIVAVLFVKKIYENKENSQVVTNERMDVLYEIKENDLKNYIVENRKTIIYTSDSLNFSIEKFERSFRDYIVKNELSKEIIYLNLNQVSSDFYASIKEKYFDSSLKNVEIPLNQTNIYVFEDGKIIDILYKESKMVSLEDVKVFLDRIMKE